MLSLFSYFLTNKLGHFHYLLTDSLKSFYKIVKNTVIVFSFISLI